jgi:hypothetical protein
MTMANINIARVIGGGLLAGLVINVCEFLVNGLWLAKDWADAMKALGKAGGSTPQMIVVFNLWGFAMGLLVVWLYAAMRPRFGAGPRTALYAALAVWFGGYLLSMLPPLMMGMFPARLMLIGIGVGLVEVIAGGNLGARIYREESTGSAAGAAAAAGR